MPKNGFPMPTAKNGFHILNLHPKNMYLKIPFFNANILEKFQSSSKHLPHSVISPDLTFS